MGSFLGIGGGDTAAAQQASQAANTQAQNATALDNYLQSIIGGNQASFGTNFAPLIAQLSQAFGGLLQGGQGGVPGGVSSFYSNEMQHGLDPTFVGNQYDRLQQQAGQSRSDMLDRLGPGGNPAAGERDITNSLLSADANLAGTLSGENQQVQQHGAQGMLDVTGVRDRVMGLLQNFLGLGFGQQEAGMSAIGGAANRAQNASQFDTQMASQDAQAAQQQQNAFWGGLMGLGTSFLPGGQFAGLLKGGGGIPGGPGNWLPGSNWTPSWT